MLNSFWDISIEYQLQTILSVLQSFGVLKWTSWVPQTLQTAVILGQNNPITSGCTDQSGAVFLPPDCGDHNLHTNCNVKEIDTSEFFPQMTEDQNLVYTNIVPEFVSR